MYKTSLLALALIAGCEAGLEPLQERETLCTSDSTVCWSQPVSDPRNTPWNDPRNCSTVETDSTWSNVCTFEDTVVVSTTYSQYYKELHPDYPHNGGGVKITIVSGDTISTKEW